MTLNVNDDENFFNKEISLQNDKCDDIDHCLSVSMDVAKNWKLCVSVGFFFCGSHALFTGSTNTDFSKFFFKIGSNGTIHIFKNYFATVFSIFSNKQYPNQPIDEFDKAIYDEYNENKLLFLDNL